MIRRSGEHLLCMYKSSDCASQSKSRCEAAAYLTVGSNCPASSAVSMEEADVLSKGESKSPTVPQTYNKMIRLSACSTLRDSRRNNSFCEGLR